MWRNLIHARFEKGRRREEGKDRWQVQEKNALKTFN
jgi:hypothetical protein